MRTQKQINLIISVQLNGIENPMFIFLNVLMTGKLPVDISDIKQKKF